MKGGPASIKGGLASIKVFLASPLRPSQLPATDRGAGAGAGADAPADAHGECRLGGSDAAGAWRLGQPSPGVQEGKELRGVEYQAAFGGLLGGVGGAGQGEDLAARASEVLPESVHALAWRVCMASMARHPSITPMPRHANVARSERARAQAGTLLSACVTCGAILCS
jgi:hypothetical protein